jgi:hypothetical protein
VLFNHLDIACILIEAQALVTTHNTSDGSTPLHEVHQKSAATESNVIQLPLKGGETLSSSTQEAIPEGKRKENFQQVFILSHIMPKLLPQPLKDVVAKKGHGAIVYTLLKTGVTQDALDKLSLMSLHIAAKKGYNEIVEVLIKSGAAVNVKRKKDHTTPLSLVTKKGHVSTIELLLRAGVHPNKATTGKKKRQKKRKKNFSSRKRDYSCP